MKRFAGIIALACMFAVACFMIAGCSAAPGPKDTVESALKAITAHDYESFAGYYAGNTDELKDKATDLGKSNGVSTNDTELTAEQQERVMVVLNKLLEFEYTVGEEHVDGDTATVDVTFTNYDIGSAAKTFMQGALTEAFSQALSGNTDKGAATESMLSNLEKAAGNLGEKNVTKEAQVKLAKGDDGTWKLVDFSSDEEYTKQLMNAVFGGVVDTMEDWAKSIADAFGSTAQSGQE